MSASICCSWSDSGISRRPTASLLRRYRASLPTSSACQTSRQSKPTTSQRTERKGKDAGKKFKKKVCVFCKDKITYVDYKDTGLLRKFISDRGKIRARRVSGNCSQHQRDVATAVKNSREMALLPYTSTAR